jgi:hypothetical protein
MNLETLIGAIGPPEHNCILCGKPTYFYYEFEPNNPKKYGFANPSRHGERQLIYIAVCEAHPEDRDTWKEILKRLVAPMN